MPDNSSLWGRRQMGKFSVRVVAALIVVALLGVASVAVARRLRDDPSYGSIATLPVAPRLTARDVAASTGLAQAAPIHTWSSPVGDVDGDGWPDVLLVRHLVEPGSLYRNVNGRFEEIVPGTFPMVDRHFCAYADVNVDGRLDVFCSLGNDRGAGTKANEMWIQQADGTFVDHAADYGLTDPLGRGRYAVFLDVNHDGLPDLFLGNAAPRADSETSPDRLFINEGGTHFRDAPEMGLDQERGSFCAQAADVDQDGWTDLLTCGNDGVHLFHNDGGTRFVEVTDASHVANEVKGVTAPHRNLSKDELINNPTPPWRYAELADIDGDGHLDLLEVATNGFAIQRGESTGFRPPTVIGSLQAGWMLAVGDVDGDGRPDVYIQQTCKREGDKIPDLHDFLLHNEGTGLRFTRVSLPDATDSCGEAVTPIDYNRDGRTDFIVLNGRDRFPGSVQLMDFAAEPGH